VNSLLDSTSERTRLAGLIALGAVQIAIYGVLAIWEGYQTRPHIAMLLALLAFAFYLAALVMARGLSGRRAFAVTVAFGLAFRILLFPEAPFLSDDHFRYLWDGIVQLSGVNPYRYAPADQAMAGIDDTLRAQVNHPEIRTIYPPLAQLVFFAAAKVSPGSYLTLKAAWLACDIGIALLLYRLIPVERRLPAWMLYWWSPLIVIEVYWNAHLDLLGIVFVVAILALAKQSPVKSHVIGLAIAAASLIKVFAVAFLPAVARSGRPYRALAGFALIVAVASVRYANVGSSTMLDGLFTYAQHWRFNPGLYRVLEWVFVSATLAKAVAAAIMILVVFNSVRNRWSVERTVLWVTGTILMLSPTVHPWYLLWMVPLLALRPNRGWLFLTGSVFLAYYGLGSFQSSGVWPEPWWLQMMIYGPFLLLLIADAWHGSWWQAGGEAIRIAPKARAS
jgi:multisubunit Na+/H+ antiporter MnhF subunit